MYIIIIIIIIITVVFVVVIILFITSYVAIRPFLLEKYLLSK
jgi:hypothetical protein